VPDLPPLLVQRVFHQLIEVPESAEAISMMLSVPWEVGSAGIMDQPQCQHHH